MQFGQSQQHDLLGMEKEYKRQRRREAPPVSLYFINDDNRLPAHKISCLYCKRTIMHDVTGVIDKVIDGPMPADDFGLAVNILCSLCEQRYRILGNPFGEQKAT